MTEPLVLTGPTGLTATLYLGDCLEILPALAAGSIDAVVTDPPYGIDGGSGHINRQRGKGNYSGMFPDTPDYIGTVIVPVVQRLRQMCGCIALTPGSKNMMLYLQPDSFGAFYQPASTGLQTFGNMDAQPIFYYGKNRNHNMGVALSWQLTESPSCAEHPCSKPQRAWNRLLCAVTREDDTILDPFMGSGTTGVACAQTGRNFVGIEIDPTYFAIAVQRIGDALKQPRLL